MNAELSSAPNARSRAPTLAWVSIFVWVCAAGLTGPLGIWQAIGSAAVTLGLAALVLDRPAVPALLYPSTRLVLLGAAAGVLMAIATYLFYPILARIMPFIAPDMAHLYEEFRGTPAIIASVVLVPVIFGEELVWRGVVQSELVRRLGAWRGVTLAAAVYALVHVPLGSSVLVAAAFFCGLAWGILRVTTASLVPTLIAHLLWDALVLLWLPLDS